MGLRWLGMAVVAAWVLLPSWGLAHPAPFSYIDITVAPDRLSGTVVLHAVDVAAALGLPDPAALGRQDVVSAQADAIVSLVTTRVAIETDGRPITWVIDTIRPMAGQDAVGIAWHAATTRPAGHLAVGARLFPEDTAHQTFVTVYEGGRVTWQEVLNRDRVRAEHYTGSRQGMVAVLRRFTASGIHHIAIGPDHILFLVGLLLPGGRVRRLLGIVTAFTIGHSVTLVLATLSIVTPPSHLVEPLIALSIVFVGADNLFVGTRARDVRIWVALLFGLVHGFGFASVLRDTGLPSTALGVSLLAFNLGVEIGQAGIVVVVASALGLLRRRLPAVAARVTTVGSVVVLLAGVYWFVERILQGRA
ncbi:MAG: HupE/UreJ family protein [Acidobacteria bacterium]|nr:HupE/UreJ family protein [Acidobacteriota bacterium]